MTENETLEVLVAEILEHPVEEILKSIVTHFIENTPVNGFGTHETNLLIRLEQTRALWCQEKEKYA